MESKLTQTRLTHVKEFTEAQRLAEFRAALCSLQVHFQRSFQRFEPAAQRLAAPSGHTRLLHHLHAKEMLKTMETMAKMLV
jgi:hypothetical protein